MLVRTLTVLAVMLVAAPALAQAKAPFAAPLSAGSSDGPSIAIDQTFSDAEAALARAGLKDGLPAKARARQLDYISRKNVSGAFVYDVESARAPTADYHAVRTTLIARRTEDVARLINFVVRIRPTGDAEGVAGATTKEFLRIVSVYGEPARCQTRDLAIEQYVCHWLQPRDARSKWGFDIRLSPGEWSYSAEAVYNE